MTDHVAPGGVRFLDLAAIHRPLRPDLRAAHDRVVARGRYLFGPELDRFEARWAGFCGTDHAVGVGSGLDALILALRALDVGPGDEVVVPSNTFIATWLAVSAVGATPVPAEPAPTTHLVTADAMAERITSRTAALLPVHLYGRPADGPAFEALAARHGLALVFDAAQAHGATVDDRPLGRFGHAQAWSFYPGKNLGALGDAGAVTTEDPALAQRVRRLRNYGSDQRYSFVERGMNSRLDEQQAANLCVALDHLPAWTDRRREIAHRYRAGLADPTDLPDLTDGAAPRLALPPVHAGHVWHLFVVEVEDRDALQEDLDHRGIETLVHYPVPPHLQGAYRDLGLGPGSLPVAEQAAGRVLSLPIGPHLDDAAVDRVIAAVREVRAGDPPT